MDKTQIYLPKVRTNYHPKESELRSFAPDGSSTKVPNPAVDDITVNNIAWQEFDYTESISDENATMTNDYKEHNIMAARDEDIFPDDKIEGDK